jgi:hypothetical protein
MNVQLATLAQASVQQLREVIRRVTSAHAHSAEELLQDEFLAGVEATEASWSDWQETDFDVRQFNV